ncbi:ABC Fe+3 siderophore transporter, periplasmic substrate-binding protein [Oceanicola granulosus HTCC2516]|uniref:ABC Fe+3 siderophore transporter, periplasmic substrate-binding protein n=1 Tax=Oceanicola granulosus (strain ATCC BAA-861 / DSM 15982 / KCTC 12143 / HTCC2516) TaxID=314256 RepID=Q2CBZ9_OCEGH|nr:siderophore ABC transporter substrate-binding protein [Oceanicola granulosus]EAR50195.1 ABC Fe+3 siderophore transporter, periplasmic substrate-binding protein [Oceanicola granulosus HTCC2516]
MRTALPALALCLAPGLLAAQDVTVETAAGPVAAPVAPGTVAVFDLAALDTISALGVPVAGVPDITPPADLDEVVAGAEIVGTLFEPDFEALAAMGPDLIVAGGRSQTQVAPLSRIAPTLDMTIWGGDMVEQALSRLAAYGTLFEREETAAALAEALEADLAEARAVVAGKGDALILLANGGKISAYGNDSRFGWLHTALDLPEAYAGLSAETHGEAVSFEFVAEVDPDWILVVDRGAAIGQDGEAAEATLDNPLVAATKAGQAGQIVYLDAAPLYLSGGGVQSMTITLGEITRAFGAAGS